MKLNIFSTYCYLSVTLSHGFHPVDENACTFAQRVSLCEGFSSFGCKPMKFISFNKSFHCYFNACNWQYLFSVPSHSTMRRVWNELLRGSIIQMFSDEKIFRLFSHPISLTATEGIFSGLEYCGWSIPVSFMLVLDTLSLHRILSFFIKLF